MHFISLKTVFRPLIAALALAIVGGSAAQAGSVVGSQAFKVNQTSVDTGDVTTATVFNFTGIKTTADKDGDFTLVLTDTSVGAGTVVLTLPSILSFGDPAFGTFTATGLLSDIIGFRSRSIALEGTFSGGTLFPGLHDASPATLIVSLNQAGGPGKSISSSLSLATEAAVPEPASFVMMGLGLGATLGLRRLRRKSA